MNHVCAFVDATKISQAVQATGPVINPLSMQPFPGEKVLTVNPRRRSIQTDALNLSLESHSDSFRLAGENIVSHSDSFRRQNSSGSTKQPVDHIASRSDSFRLVSRSNSSVVADAAAAGARASLGGFTDPSSRANSSGAVMISQSLSRSGDDGLGSPRSQGSSVSGRPSVAFSDPLAQEQKPADIAQQALAAESSDDVFFPTDYPPSSGNLVFSSRNSSVNSTYGNESDTSSTNGDAAQQRSTISGILNVDLGLSRFFRF